MKTILQYFFILSLIFFSACEKKEPIEPSSPLNVIQDTIIISNDILKEVFWTRQHVYHIINNIRIEPNAVIHISEGTIIRLAKGVIVMNDATIGKPNSNGKILAYGTADSPITFTSLETQKSSGDWGSINLIGESPSEFEYCDFEYGGWHNYAYVVDWGMISLYGAKVGFRNCSFSNSDKYGVYCQWVEDRFTFFENNSFHGMEIGSLSIHPNSVSSIGENNTFELGKLLTVHSGFVDSDFTPLLVPDVNYHLWAKQNVPYTITGEVTVGTTLEIEKGSELLFDPYGKLTIGMSGWPNEGELICEGSLDAKISMTANQLNWGGIRFQNTQSGQSVLNYCTITYAGDQMQGSVVILNQEGQRVSISNSEIAYSPGYGIFKDVLPSVDPVLGNVNFHDNAKGDKNW